MDRLTCANLICMMGRFKASNFMIDDLEDVTEICGSCYWKKEMSLVPELEYFKWINSFSYLLNFLPCSSMIDL